jgi:hypothetical protein
MHNGHILPACGQRDRPPLREVAKNALNSLYRWNRSAFMFDRPFIPKEPSMLTTLGKWSKALAVSTACLGMIVPAGARATDNQVVNLPATQAVEAALPVAQDVALGPGGTLEGCVVDAQGNAVPAAPVSVHQQQVEVVKLTADQTGSFAVSGLRGGVYRLVSLQGDGVYRAWPAGTAPPSARQRAVIKYVQFSEGESPLISLLTSPWTIAAFVAAAIAVPVTLANRNHDSNS